MNINQQKLEYILSKLDLNKNQITFYLTLIELGDATLSEIVFHSDLSRPTAYRISEELLKMGIVASDLKKYKETFYSSPPEKLVALAGTRQRKLRRLELDIKDSIPELNLLFNNQKTKPKVELFEDEDGYFYLVNQILDCQEKILYFIGNISDLYEVIGEDYDKKIFIPSRLKKKIKMKWLVEKNKTTLSYQKEDHNFLRETRFLDPNYKIESTILIFDDTIVFFSSYKQKMALAVTNSYLAQTQKQMFKMIWEKYDGNE